MSKLTQNHLWGHLLYQSDKWSKADTPFSHGFFAKTPDIKTTNQPPCEFRTEVQLRILRQNQVHENNWIEILSEDSAQLDISNQFELMAIASGIYLQNTNHSADGWIAHLDILHRGKIALGVATADCTPVLGYCPDLNLVLALHCGWRSAVSEILPRVLTRVTTLGAHPQAIELAIGPSAGIDCYEVGEEVEKQTLDSIEKALWRDPSLRNFDQNSIIAHVPTPQGNKTYVRIAQLLKLQSLSLGLQSSNIAISDICTICDQRFHSHRRQGHEAGRQWSFICAYSN